MEMGNFRGESHVAQKSRRDKLRIQQNSDQNQHLEDYATNNMEQLSVHHQPLGPSSKYESLSYDPNVFSPEMFSYVARSSQQFLPQNDTLVCTDHQESASTQFDRANGSNSFAHSSHLIPSNSTWKGIGPQHSCDWVVNYPNSCSLAVDQGNLHNFSSPSLHAKPSSLGYQHDLDSFNVSQKHHHGETHYGSSPICQNNLQEVVTSASLAQSHNLNELLLLPSYGDQSKTLHVNNDPRWVSTSSVGGCHQWNANSSYLNSNKSIRDQTTVANDSSSNQGLSLSLSSVPRNKDQVGPFRRRGDSQDLINDLSGSIAFKSDQLCNVGSKGFIGSKNVESSGHNLVGTSNLARSTGPLGPFTGYATILKSSKYLKPTQELLSESCHISNQEHVQTCEAYSQKDSEDMVRANDGDSRTSSSALYGSNDNICGEAGDGGRSSSAVSYRPEFQQKKAKLLYMQDEMRRRYKQYQQQMQMVVSSFESVAGLSSATPYISLALKAVTRHFRSLKNVITVQLKHTRKALGEDLSSSPTTGMSSSKGDRAFDHSFQKHQKSSGGGGGGGGFFEPQQPVWRPQRGLPERAVSVLRAWLFDHFLHPYPTDTDKHMLATQTGLTRNQVSNWFINARVRVWKPMVEEIHTLETKAMEEPNSNTGNQMDSDEIPRGRVISTNTTSNMQGESSNTVTLARMGPNEASPVFWNQDKRSRIECQNIPTSVDGSLFGFEPYQQRGIGMGGLGAVSLTLGLRQSAENAQQKQQLLNQEHQLRQQFGGHIYKYS